jgi:predicted Zn-ribbon and HTH transcriptional regulator
MSQSEATQTIRARLKAELLREPGTAHELSARVRVSEKEIPGHLEHLEKSLKAEGSVLEVQPASCIACGFSFKKRERFSKPSRCPKCGSERIDPPVFSITSAAQ